jgi:hypothetical protein
MSHESNDYQLLSAYLDDELSLSERKVIESQLTEGSELKQLLEDWKIQQIALRSIPIKKLENDLSETVLQTIQRNKNQRKTNLKGGKRLMAIGLVAALLLIFTALNIPELNQRLGWITPANQTELASNQISEASEKEIQPDIAIRDQPSSQLAAISPQTGQADVAQLNKLRFSTEKTTGESEAMAQRSQSASVVNQDPRSAVDPSNQILFIDLSHQAEGMKLVGEVLKTNQIQIVSDVRFEPPSTEIDSSQLDASLQVGGELTTQQADQAAAEDIEKTAIAKIQQAFAPGIEAILVVAKQSQLDQVIGQLNQRAKIVSFEYPDLEPWTKLNQQLRQTQIGNLGGALAEYQGRGRTTGRAPGGVAGDSEITQGGIGGMGGMGMGGISSRGGQICNTSADWRAECRVGPAREKQ